MVYVYHILSVFLLSTLILGQENTQTSVAKSLMECYNDTDVLIKDERLPMTLNSLLDLIVKIEDGPDRMDLRALAVSMLQRFRQDGIRRAFFKQNMDEGILPFSPNGKANDKFKIVLKYMVPGNAIQFPNDTLNIIERCTLHSMISTSIEDWERGDETQVCSKLGKYKRRFRRSSAIPEDVEIIQEETSSSRKKTGNIKAHSDVERIGQINEPKSDCPVENGVISTPWGAVSVGPLIAGIAAGAQPELNINVKKITGDASYITDIDNLWGATIAGDLAEAALYKNEEDDIQSVEVGAAGGWNSTDVPHWYFLEKNIQLHFTDAEIRGGLDGLILGNLYRNELSRKIPSLKLSTLLDMYYSPLGVFDEKYRACGRRELFKEVAPLETIKEQTIAFAIALDKNARLRISLDESAIIKSSTQAALKLEEYVPSRLNDPNCQSYAATEISSSSTNIIIAIDTQWTYKEFKKILSVLLIKLDVNKYNTNYTIFNAMDGQIIINSSCTANDLQAINQTSYDKLPKGNDLDKTIRQFEELARDLMKAEVSGPAGGRSLVALFIPFTDPEVSQYAKDRVKDYINIFTPDLKIFILTKGDKEIYANIVKDTTRDVVYFQADNSPSTTVASWLAPLIERIQEVPRRFVNLKCGADWTSIESSNQVLTQYLTSKTINYYRIHPNYFYGEGSRSIKIKSTTAVTLTVCHSRNNIQPKANQTGINNGDVNCKTDHEHVIPLTDACKDKTFIHDCVPMYFSVEAPSSNEYICTDPECRYPTDLKYTLIGENLVCISGAHNVYMSYAVIVLALTLLKVNV